MPLLMMNVSASVYFSSHIQTINRTCRPNTRENFWVKLQEFRMTLRRLSKIIGREEDNYI